MTQAEVAERLGLDLTNYNRLENGKVELTYNRMRELADIFNVEPVDLISDSSGVRTVRVRGWVEAGSWREASEWDEQDWYDVAVPATPGLSTLSLYGAETRGPSMNRVYPEGTVIIFTSMIERPEELEVGKRYVVEREKSDGLREATVKALARDESGNLWLMPDSNDPRHQEPIALGGDAGDIIRIIGRVVYSVRPE
ncbi:putative transcriptional regulator [Hoeflea phototrophica DFL-43]|jgi:transcriptional regulator with XRE-family HTH domain|uniref:Putative transcriptional regulator n=2 Tax=Hoeflea TaxID=274591 RepID=A9D4P0_HOEPD|nr:putative transcriptional regulator [Hoeflea phototrophica DFL-43]